MAELLLELLSEEIPARMQTPMAENLQKSMKEWLDKENLFFSSIKSFSTPRRLVLSIEGLSLTQEDITTEKRGPRIDAPQQALDGFLRSTGLTKNQLTTRDTGKGEFYFAITEQKGRPTKDVLVEALQNILPSLTWPKSMRWGDHEVRWVRPLKSILAVFGGDILPITFGPITAGNSTQGHRFLSPNSFKATDLNSYKSGLEKRFVTLDEQIRKRYILEEARKLASNEGLELLEDNNLLTEVAGLVEYPQVLLGKIDDDFMDLPEEVLISSIRTHQKYFCLRNKQGELSSHFIVVSNMKTEDGGKQIVAGNERVLRARLSDACFFRNQDRKTSLSTLTAGLERVVFHAKLGTVADKTNRITSLAKYLAVWIPHADLPKVTRAATLCKTDLVSEMVGEFPELQGIMGRYYALDAGEDSSVANAIQEHYAPLGPSDTCPTQAVSIAISIADKVDSLVGLFAIDEKPTGSKDPFALRRAALGVIRIILENRLSIPLRLVLEQSIKSYPSSVFRLDRNDDNNDDKGTRKLLNKLTGKRTKPADVVDELLVFFGDRLKALLKADNVRHDLISSVFDNGEEDDLLRAVCRVAALDRFLKTDDGENLLAAYRRAANIVRIEEKKDERPYRGTPSKALLTAISEEDLFEALTESRDKIKRALKDDKFEKSMEILANLRAPIDAFFDDVQVNCDDNDTRKNRLKLLALLREQCNDIACFDLIETP